MINIYTVKNEMEDSGWVLLSTEYKNLNSPLEMKCPEGHVQEKTFGDWRRHPVCDKCLAGDAYKVKRKKVPEKQPGVKRILALDAATIDAGYSLYDGNKLITFGVHHISRDLDATARINEFKHWLIEAIKEWNPDYVGVEHIHLQMFRGTPQVEMYRVLANLQGVIFDTLYELKINGGLARPSEWRKYCGINTGDQARENKKRLAQEKVHEWYGIVCTQDEADAICIGKYFINHSNVSHPVELVGEDE